MWSQVDLESITTNKVSGGDGIPAELFQILNDDVIKVLHSICQEIWKTQQWPQDWKRSVFIPVPKKGNAKECSNYHTVEFISHASKIMLKNPSSQSSAVYEPRTSRCTSWVSKRQRNQRSNCQHSLDHSEIKGVPEKYLLLLLWLCGSQRTGKFLKRWKYQTTLPASWETCMRVKKQQLEPDMEQQTGSKLGKEYVKAVYCHPAYLTYM